MESPSISSLPNELKEDILLRASPRELLTFCSTSREFYSLCSNPSFWEEKFRQKLVQDFGLSLSFAQTLSLLEKGTSPSSWLRIYERSLKAVQETRRFLSTSHPYLSFNPNGIATVEPLLWLGIPVDLAAWEGTREFLSLMRLLRVMGSKESPEIKTRLLQLRDYFSHVILTRREGQYILDYTFKTPYEEGEEELTLTLPQVEGFLYRYYYYKNS